MVIATKGTFGPTALYPTRNNSVPNPFVPTLARCVSNLPINGLSNTYCSWHSDAAG